MFQTALFCKIELANYEKKGVEYFQLTFKNKILLKNNKHKSKVRCDKINE